MAGRRAGVHRQPLALVLPLKKRRNNRRAGRGAPDSRPAAGYANGVLSYLPTADEYPYGGYECDYAHHSYGLVEQVAPESEAILVNGCLDLLTALWE